VGEAKRKFSLKVDDEFLRQAKELVGGEILDMNCEGWVENEKGVIACVVKGPEGTVRARFVMVPDEESGRMKFRFKMWKE